MTITKLLKNSWLHLKKIITHKYYVAKYCFKVGLYWQGIIHDMSKFSPTEFLESIKYYVGTSSPIDACKKDKGYSLAWFHHRGRNYHHYEMWIDNFNNGGVALLMPKKYAYEMACDYVGAAKSYMGANFTWSGELKWWNVKKQKAKMHEKIVSFLSITFETMATYEQFNPGKADKFFDKTLLDNAWEYAMSSLDRNEETLE